MSEIRIGVCGWSYPNKDLLGSMGKMKELGLEALALDMNPDFKEVDIYEPEMCDKYLEKAKEMGIEITALALNCLGGCAPFLAENDEQLNEIIKGAKKIANQLNIKILQVPAFGKAMIHTKEEFDLTVEFFKKLCDYVADDGIIVGTENALSCQENLDFCKAVDRENVKIYFDTQNPFVVNNYDATEMAEKFGDLICQIHAKDGTGSMSNRKLGEGESNFFATAEKINQIPYKGIVLLENNYLNIADKDEAKAYEILAEDIAIAKKVFE